MNFLVIALKMDGMNTKKPLYGYMFAALAALGWASGGLIAQGLFRSNNIDPATLTGVRTTCAFFILTIFLLLFRRKSFVLKHPLRNLAFLVPFGAIALAGMNFTYLQSIQISGVAPAILMEYMAPIFTLAVGVVLFKQKLQPGILVGVALAIFGCAVVVGIFNRGALTVTPRGVIWGVASVIAFGLYGIMGDKGPAEIDTFSKLYYGMLFSMLLWIVVLGPARVVAPLMSPKTVVPILIVSIVSTAMSFGAFLAALNLIDATRASVTAMLEPVAAGIGAAVFFGQHLTRNLVIGGLIVLGAIAFIQITERSNAQRFPRES
ncbi:MAG: DMT family transporter [Coriobacteriia bacterium]|nr:DMT family transporter [Coriobacteriia bacterium]